MLDNNLNNSIRFDPKPPVEKRPSNDLPYRSNLSSNAKIFVGSSFNGKDVEPTNKQNTLYNPYNNSNDINNYFQNEENNLNIASNQQVPINQIEIPYQTHHDQNFSVNLVDYQSEKTEIDLNRQNRIIPNNQNWDLDKESHENQDLKTLNLRLTLDLAAIADKYMELFFEYEKMQNSNKNTIQFKNNEIRELKITSELLKIENEQFQKLIDQMKENEKALKDDYDSRITRLRDDLHVEREERCSLIIQLNDNYDQLQQLLTNSGKDDGESINDKAILLHKISGLQTQLEYCKATLVTRQLKLDAEGALRSELGQANKRKTKYGRMYYIGNAKSFQEILVILEKMNDLQLYLKDRLLALEELCIFCHSNDENLERVRQFKGAFHATKSLPSTNKAIVLRGLHLLSLLCYDSQKCSDQLIENGGINYIREALDDADEDIRIEAIAVTRAISNFETIIPLIIKNYGVTRILTLLQEGKH